MLVAPPIATIPLRSLPHGIWPFGSGSRVYVALENSLFSTSSHSTYKMRAVRSRATRQTANPVCEALIYFAIGPVTEQSPATGVFRQTEDIN